MRQQSGRAAFLISKPLQLMVALCIARQVKLETKPVFVIIDTFCGASQVAERLSCDFDQLQTPVYFDSRQAALSFLKKQKFDHLFIDSDVGLRNFLTLASFKLAYPKISIHVYEEGLGTYRTDLYSGFKKKIFVMFGIGAFFGACRFVTSVYVYRTQEYIDNIPSNGFKVREIQGGLLQFLVSNRDALKRVFGFNGIKPISPDVSRCSIYLSSWRIDADFLSYFQGLKGDLFMKPHPHIRSYDEINGIKVIGANIPAELVLTDLMKVYDSVVVFDHNSSVRRYITGKNIVYKIANIPKEGGTDVYNKQK